MISLKSSKNSPENLTEVYLYKKIKIWKEIASIRNVIQIKK